METQVTLKDPLKASSFSTPEYLEWTWLRVQTIDNISHEWVQSRR